MIREIATIDKTTNHVMRNFINNFLLTLSLCSVITYLAFAQFDYSLTGIDDANIFFVYAKNIANGFGFVYNAGGERVEGFTSLLWTLICAFAFKLSSHPELILLIVSIVLISFGIAITLGYLQNDFLDNAKTQEKRLYSGIFLILLLTSPRYMVWNTITLMENALWSTGLLLTTIFVIKTHPSWRRINREFTPLLILLILTRPESMLWGIVFIGVLFIRLTFSQNVRIALKTLTPSILCFITSIILMGLFQLYYFGYPFPNTFYAKVSPSLLYNIQQGMVYLSKYSISDPIVLLSVIAIVIASIDTLAGILRKQIPDDGSFFLSMIGAIGLLEPLLIGGDHFGSFRLYQNIYPIEVLCLLYFGRKVFPRILRSPEKAQLSRTGIQVGLISALIVLFPISQFQIWRSIKSEINIEFRVADYGRKSGAFIQQLFSPLPKLPSLGVVTSGGIKYSYTGNVVDLMGLNNTLMAHNQGDRKGIKDHAAFDIPTFYRLHPDIVWPLTVIEKDWRYSQGDIKQSWENTEGLKGLFDQPYFLALYRYAKVSSRAQHVYALVGWFSKDLLKQLNSDSNFVVEEYDYSP